MKMLIASQQVHSGAASSSRFESARALALSLAESDSELLEPEIVAWSDRPSRKESPVLEGCGGPNGWSHYDAYAHFSPGPFVNLRDRAGREWVCLASSLSDPHNPLSPSRTACIPVDEASCEFG